MGGKYMEKGTDGAIQTGWHHSWREGNARYTRQYATRTAASYLKSAAAPSGSAPAIQGRTKTSHAKAHHGPNARRASVGARKDEG